MTQQLNNIADWAVTLDGADLSSAILDGARWTDGTRICGAGSMGRCQ